MSLGRSCTILGLDPHRRHYFRNPHYDIVTTVGTHTPTLHLGNQNCETI